MNFLKCLLVLIFLTLTKLVNADEIDCYLPSLKDGKIIQRISISLKHREHISVKRQRASTPFYEKELKEQVILFHHYSDPREILENGKILQWEPPQSLVITESKSEGLEFSPDMLIIDWKTKSLKTATTYDDKLVNRWKCI